MSEEAKHTPLSAFLSYLVVLFVLLSLLVRPLVPGEAHEFGVNLVLHVLVLTGLLVWALLFLLDQHVLFVRARIEVPAVLFAALLVASPFVAGYRYGAIARVSGWAADLVLFYLVYNIAVHPRLRNFLFRAAVGAALAVAVYGAYQHAYLSDETLRELETNPAHARMVGEETTRDLLERAHSERPFSTMMLATQFGAYLVLFLPAVFGLVLDRLGTKKPGRALPLASDLVALFLLAYALFLSRTRGAFLALGLGGIVFVALSWREILSTKRRVAVAMALVGLALGSVGLAWRAGGFGEHPLEEAKKSMEFRFGYWTGAWNVARSHPWLGVGADNLRFHYFREKPAWAPEAVHAHNNYLQFAAEFGVPGAIVLVSLWGALFVSMARKPREKPDRPRPLAANHFEPLPFSRGAAGTLAVLALGASFLVFVGLGAVVGGFLDPPEGWSYGGFVLLLLALAVAYVLLDFQTASRESLPERFRARGLAAGVAAGLAHWAVDIGLYHVQVNQTLWVVAALAAASFRPKKAAGDVVLARLPFLTLPSAEAKAAGNKASSGEAAYLARLVLAMALVVAPWGLLVFKVMVPQFEAAAFLSLAKEAEFEAASERVAADRFDSTNPRKAGEKRAHAIELEERSTDYLAQAVDRVPGHLDARLALGRRRFERWRTKVSTYKDVSSFHALFEEAEGHLLAARDAAPDYSGSRFALYRLYRQRGEVRMGAPDQDIGRGGERARKDPVLQAIVREGWQDIRTGVAELEEAILRYPTNADYLLEAGRAHARLSTLFAEARAVVPDLEEPGFDPGARSDESYAKALECSAAAIDGRLELSTDEVAEARKALEEKR
ncbi:MAG: O-antigen ligase family protein [Planctomycetes bacterium]|nr:O-antigen ligase family protein [Planctomycetota bacterium]